ncbi:MAG: PAS domain S-box protein, partial [bacterium]
MKIPETPSRESQRLAALREYDVLDTIPEQALDDLAALAAQICGAPIALVSLVDEGRQWFKARVGFEPPETTRDVSFCGHAILGTGVFIVPDATVDDRFADNPLVVGDPKVRFYAGAPLVTNDGHSIGALCVMDHVARDLTAAQGEALQMLSRQVVGQLELRRQARDLAESEARLHAVFANCPVAMTIHRMSDRTFVTVNSAFTQLLGWEEREVVGRTSDEVHFVSPDVAQQIRARLDAGGLRGDEVWQAWTKNGDKRHVLISSTVVDITRGPHAITTFVDVSRRSESELAANRLAAIVASSEDAIVGKALDGTVTSWNPGAERLFGLSAAEMVGNAIRRVIPADRQGEEDEIIARIASGEVIPHFETERLTRDGRVICVSVAASPIRDEHGTVCGGSTVTRDITERKRIEAAQRESDLRYRALFDYQPDGIVIADRESYYLDANASLCEMLGYSREEIVGLHASSIVAPEEVPYVGRALQQINSGVAYRREWQFVRKDRRTFPAEVRATLMPDGNLIGIVRDVTERNKSEARFRRLIDSNVQGVVFWRGDGEIFDANDAFLAIADLERSEIASGRVRWAMLTPPEYAGADARAMEDVRTRGAFAPYEKELLRRDGSRRHVLVGGASLGDGTSECVGFVVDSTDRKRLEDQFLRAQRMESIGTLAGGIAHDLNNALLPIMLSVEVLKEIVKDGEALEFLDTLEASARHGAELVQQVLSFARGVEGQRI